LSDALLQTSAEDDSQPVRLHLKWFNGTKGFGFVVPEDGSFDAFLHITTLQEAGLHILGEGAVLLCRVGNGNKGKQVSEIIEVIEQGKINMLPESNNEDGTVTMGGLVKWFKPEKGFGFIIPDDGMKDIFVHKSLLDKLGIEDLVEGQRVLVTLKMVDKGREAISVEIVR
jgi:CspA family cold shock protein